MEKNNEYYISSDLDNVLREIINIRSYIKKILSDVENELTEFQQSTLDFYKQAENNYCNQLKIILNSIS